MVHNSSTKIFPDTLFSQNESPEQCFLKKAFPEKSNHKTFKEIKNVYWAIVPVVQVNQDAATLTFVLESSTLWKIIKKNNKQPILR